MPAVSLSWNPTVLSLETRSLVTLTCSTLIMLPKAASEPASHAFVLMTFPLKNMLFPDSIPFATTVISSAEAGFDTTAPANVAVAVASSGVTQQE